MQKFKRLTHKSKGGGYHTTAPWDVVENRLAELENKIESGKLVELPCRVGDTIYVVPSHSIGNYNKIFKNNVGNEVQEWKVYSVAVRENGFSLRLYMGDYLMSNVHYDTVSELYKETWFLTREEAEARVKELRGEA